MLYNSHMYVIKYEHTCEHIGNVRNDSLFNVHNFYVCVKECR